MNSKEEKSMGFFTRKEKTIFSKAQKEELKTLRARVKDLEESYEKNRSNDIKKELDDCLYKIRSIKEESAIYVGYKAVWDLKEIDDLIDKLIHLKDTRDLITKDVENESDLEQLYQGTYIPDLLQEAINDVITELDKQYRRRVR